MMEIVLFMFCDVTQNTNVGIKWSKINKSAKIMQNAQEDSIRIRAENNIRGGGEKWIEIATIGSMTVYEASSS